MSPSVWSCAVARCDEGAEWWISQCAAVLGWRDAREGEKDSTRLSHLPADGEEGESTRWRGRMWSRGEIWTGKARDVARTKKEGEGGSGGQARHVVRQRKGDPALARAWTWQRRRPIGTRREKQGKIGGPVRASRRGLGLVNSTPFIYSNYFKKT
jgi:hypothetical protein